MTEHSRIPEGKDPLAEKRAAMAAASVRPLWERVSGNQPNEPVSVPAYVWRWAELDPLIDYAAHAVPMEHVERRVLTLVNPHLADSPTAGSTQNLVGALQILLPGETARSHRHSGNALRFVLEGEGAETIVNGKSCPMAPGDLILTPDWCWHGHAHHGEGRFVWFDSLDVGLIRHMDSGFFDGNVPDTYPEEVPDAAFGGVGLAPETAVPPRGYSPLFRYPWQAVSDALDDMPPRDDGARALTYVDPLTGGPAMPRMEMGALRPPKGSETRAYRATCDAICVVAEGSGTSRIGDKEIAWSKHDIFTLPHWQWVTHRADEARTTLFIVSDRDMMEKLGLLREEKAA